MSALSAVLVYCALVIVAIRGPLVFQPEEHAARLKRWFFPSDERMRLVGLGMLVAVAAPLVLVSRAAPPSQSGQSWVEALGWLVVAGGAFVLATPALGRRLVERVLAASRPPVLRVVGILNIAFGLLLVWAAIAIS